MNLEVASLEQAEASINAFIERQAHASKAERERVEGEWGGGSC